MSDAGDPPISVFFGLARFGLESIGPCALQQCYFFDTRICVAVTSTCAVILCCGILGIIGLPRNSITSRPIQQARSCDVLPIPVKASFNTLSTVPRILALDNAQLGLEAWRTRQLEKHRNQDDRGVTKMFQASRDRAPAL